MTDAVLHAAVVSAVALVASGLTLFSGFGLGSLLMPAFALFFPVPVAVAATAVVHLANNLFKLALVGRAADRAVVLRFGLPALLAALVGAALLTSLGALPPLWRLTWGARVVEGTVVKAAIGGLIVAFSLLELSPRFAAWRVEPRWLPWGGALSGFFGGLSGHQGALRSAFLIKAGLSKEAFVGTSAVCTAMVDVARLLAYAVAFEAASWHALPTESAPTVAAATLAAFLGAWGGAKLLHKVTLATVQRVVAVAMVLIGWAMVVGVV